ncbi:creatininase family protein [Paenibacillus aurantius]|uniref:Creatininase family protein n=1 Tax=Paenibacillus aurantius TaxID=2918900 RepID=A0AA96LF20_9BACL|nr:creatininase family protein [Paenibacillus aurantius]WNQ12546.1 creatininase family protein [Paenibacillus aurantius]
MDFQTKECFTAVLPVGAIEQHGSHLPVGTDAIIAEEIASRLAERLDAYLLPCVSISSSIEHRESKGTVYLKADTLALVIRDIAESLRYTGFKRLVLFSGHGGNWILKPTIRQLNRDFRERGEEMELILIPSTIALNRLHEIAKHVQGDLHAGEKETSLMLYLCPEHVKDIIPEEEPTAVPQDFMDYFDVTEMTADGYWGFPQEATADKGRRLLDLTVDCAVDFLDKIESERKRITAKR